MPDMLETAVEYLDEVRKSLISQTVVYARGGTMATILATPTQQEFAIDNLDGTITTLVATDWIVTVADIAPFSTPQRGDQVRWTKDGVAHNYEVMGPGGGPVYEDADPYRQAFKIHTKYVGT